MLKDLLIRNRSYRRFHQETRMNESDLKELVEAARISPSARNDQPLKYILVHSKSACETLFPSCAWAGYLIDWDGPAEDERPTAYIILLNDIWISKDARTDAGIACQSILLRAVEKGFGGCILGTLQRENIRRNFGIAPQFKILYVIALGKPSETVLIEKMKDNNTHYYRDNKNIHHVPKRALSEIIIDSL